LLGVRVSESVDPERETGSVSGGFGVGFIIGKVILLVVPQLVSLLNGRVAAVRKLVDRTPTQIRRTQGRHAHSYHQVQAYA
jgi:hypothetical protein